ncbi:AMP-binding protein [Williamsia muralis]|uniref:AMP-dependent synthetase n=1 Tax=Williamsia marianensis TaxID=85044 RepID=A0A2G3PS58_WILMA|nr:AMP-binding protein [Williamsia marianensis]PHV68644.1 AMP-dependent synthetase [Williamsia marianensis]PZT99078.1 MAG: AMP-dependent synthetase [Gordonia sp. (in: high G+C Gram-positive bacteria)]
MNAIDDRVAELLAQYDNPEACAADLLCDRHPGDAIAFTVIDSAGAGSVTSVDLTYGHLREQSSRFAAALAELGVEPGDRVATLMGKSADLIVAALGIWRRGAVYVPLFTAFAPPAIAYRLQSSGAKIVISDLDQLTKLAPGEDMPADAPWQVIAAGDTSDDRLQLSALIDAHTSDGPGASAVTVGGDGLLVELFTSGTTGTPKGVPVPVRALASFHAYQEFGLDVRPEDVFWNAADPGWAYGLYYALLGPMASGTRSLLLHAGFSPALTWQVLREFEVTNFAAAPTVYRALRAGGSPPEKITLRRASSAGEPLTPDVVGWSTDALGVAVRDHYGQTEHGMFIVNAWHDSLRTDVPAGSMGRALPGWSCAVLQEDSDDVAPAGTLGRVSIDTASSQLLWFNGYVNAPEKTASRYTGDGRWYLTGDSGAVDGDGFYFFSSRDDDVIIMAGYRIGPFDVESVLVMHDAVMEAAVVGKSDELRGEVLEAYVVLHDSAEPSPELEADLQQLVKRKFAAHAYPRKVHFIDALPKTPSGKVQRFVLRQR